MGEVERVSRFPHGGSAAYTRDGRFTPSESKTKAAGLERAMRCWEPPSDPRRGEGPTGSTPHGRPFSNKTWRMRLIFGPPESLMLQMAAIAIRYAAKVGSEWPNSAPERRTAFFSLSAEIKTDPCTGQPSAHTNETKLIRRVRGTKDHAITKKAGDETAGREGLFYNQSEGPKPNDHEEAKEAASKRSVGNEHNKEGCLSRGLKIGRSGKARRSDSGLN